MIKNSSKKGIALIVVLMLCTILVVVVSEFAYSCKIDVYTSFNQGNDAQNRYALLAFLNRAIARLQLDAMVSEKENKDNQSAQTSQSPQNPQSSQGGKQGNNDSFVDVWASKQTVKINETEVVGNIVDEARKFSLLLLLPKKKKGDDKKEEDKKQDEKQENDKTKQPKKTKIDPKKQFLDLLRLVLKKQGEEAEGIHKNILAWLKDKKGKSSEKYSTDIPAYSTEEMILAKGITKSMLFGSKENKALIDYVTIWGQGKININTADPIILQTLSSKMTPEIVNSIVEQRKKKVIFKKTSDIIIDTKVTKAMLGQIEKSIGVGSQYFTITARAKTDNMEKHMKAIVYRKDSNVYTIYCEFK